MKYIFKIILILSLTSINLFSLPANGKLMDVKLPDGNYVSVKVYGDEFYRRVESFNGYTLCKDSLGWIYYAILNETKTEFKCSSYRYYGKEEPVIRGIEKHLRLPNEIRAEKINKARYELLGANNRDKIRRPLKKIIGGTILIDFPDDTAVFTKSQMEDLMNKIGYTDFGNKSSVREYFLNMSNGQFDYENKVIGYYRAQNSKDYYENNNLKLVLIEEALRGVDAEFDYSQLTYNIKTIKAINILYAGACRSAWGQGLWPHAGQYRYETNDGVNVANYQMAAIDTGLSIGPIAHENAHMLLDLSDLYDTQYGSHGIGYFALMGYGCLLPTPTPINAFYRNKLGWEEAINITDAIKGTIFKHVPNSTTSYLYQNPKSSREHFYIESRKRSGNYPYQPDEGLMIWHVDEWAFFQNPDMMPSSHYYVSLEQADGNFDMEKAVNGGDSTDLFKSGSFTKFNENTVPNSDWWKDGESGLKIHNINTTGDTVRFTIGEEITQLNSLNDNFRNNIMFSFDSKLNKINLQNCNLSNLKIKLFNSAGRKVFECTADSGCKYIYLNKALPKGVYCIEIKGVNSFKAVSKLTMF